VFTRDTVTGADTKRQNRLGERLGTRTEMPYAVILIRTVFRGHRTPRMRVFVRLTGGFVPDWQRDDVASAPNGGPVVRGRRSYHVNASLSDDAAPAPMPLPGFNGDQREPNHGRAFDRRGNRKPQAVSSRPAIPGGNAITNGVA